MAAPLPFRPDQAKHIERGDLRDVVLIRCSRCQWNFWVSTMKRCPQCKSFDVEELERKMLAAKRI
jgi:predicted Zn-ribbon and HTH transcriptional regulator